MAPIDEAHRLRSMFLADMNQAEGMIDLIILRYFDLMARNPHHEQAQAWLLARISMKAKIDVLGALADHVAFDARELLRELRELNDVRNRIAHSAIAPDLSGLGGELGGLVEFAKLARDSPTEAAQRLEGISYTVTHSTGRGVRSSALDLEELNAHRYRARSLTLPLWQMWAHVHAHMGADESTGMPGPA